MKKIKLISAILLLSGLIGNAQNVSITSVNFPTLLTDTEAVQVEVSCMFTAGGCPLTTTLQYASNDTAYIIAYYQVGMLSVICNETDIFNLGILPCSYHTLFFEAIVNGGTTTDQGFFAMNINCTTVGIPKSTIAEELIVFPNPVANDLYFQMPDKNISAFKFSIYNPEGIKVLDDNKLISNNTSLQHIDVSSLSKGLYFLKVESANGVIIRKLIKN